MNRHQKSELAFIVGVLLPVWGLLMVSFSGIQPRLAAQSLSCSGPVNGADSAQNNLDHSEDDWGVYCEGTPQPRMQNVAAPSVDGESLECAITGGVQYSNVHCYRNLLPEPDAAMFRMEMSFWFSETTCNSNDSIVQALEFTMNKWHQGKRYEFAIQWQNVGAAAAQWRYWDPAKHPQSPWVAFDPPILQCLVGGNTQHTLSMEGAVDGGQAELRTFTIDGQAHIVNLKAPPVNDNASQLAVAVQVDGNASETPYSLFIDQVNFTRWVSPLAAPLDGSVSTTNSPTFSWNAVPNAVQYEMQLGFVYPPTTTVLKSNALTYASSDLMLRDYYWRVRGIQANGDLLPWSPIECVNIQSPLQGRPQLTYFNTREPNLSWKALTWATEYQIQIDDSSAFTLPLEYDATVSSATLSATPFPLHDCTHYWHVRAKNANGVWQSWSATDNFFINAP